MPTARQKILEEGIARSPQAPTEGFRDLTFADTQVEVDLTSWAGQIVKIRCVTQDIYYGFGTTGFTMTIDSGADVAVGTAGVADRLRAGPEGIEVVVPDAPRSFMRYRSIDTTAATLVIIPK